MKTVSLLIVVAGLALLAACSGPAAPAGPGGAPQSQAQAQAPSAVAYSHCMRSHGVPSFPDPASNGSLPKTSAQTLGVSSSRFESAQHACQAELPATTSSQQQARQCLLAGDCPQALVQQMLTADRRFAACMRSHGVPSWPDPTLGPEGGPVFNLVPAGITHSQTHSPPISDKLAECGRLDPAAVAMESN